MALLAANNPIAIIPSAFLFGVLSAGSRGMQLASRVPPELIQVIQALVLIFVAAPVLVRWLFRVRVPREAESVTGEVQLTSGWGKAET